MVLEIKMALQKIYDGIYKIEEIIKNVFFYQSFVVCLSSMCTGHLYVHIPSTTFGTGTRTSILKKTPADHGR
jgi:hypothetical protein